MMKHLRSFGEITDPQGVGVVSRPAATDHRLRIGQLLPRHASLAEVAVQSRLGNGAAKLVGQDFVDGVGTATRLLAFELDGPLKHGPAAFADAAAVGAGFPLQAGDPQLLELADLAAERGERGPNPRGPRSFLYEFARLA